MMSTTSTSTIERVPATRSASGIRQRHTETAKKKNVTTIQPKSADKTLLEKLINSKEEPLYGHIHKVLGISCLLSFIYRFWNVFNGKGGNFGPHWGTLGFCALHLSLHLTSYIFELPPRRISHGYRIWNEFRHHALVFTSRSLLCMLVIAYEQHFHPQQAQNQPDSFWYANLAIVLATCAGADLGTRIGQGTTVAHTTIRGTTLADPFEHWFASEQQFMLTAFSLIGFDSRYTAHLSAVFVIQCNALCMTLQRRNVASQPVLTTVYGAMLVFAFWVIVYEDLEAEKALVPATFGAVAVILRMGPWHINKYLLWILLGLVWYGIQTTHIVSTYNSEFWLVAFGVSKLIALGLGLRKRAQQVDMPKNPIIYRSVIASHVILGIHILLVYVGVY
ncbi:expressed unknown protein [Seminavis robusta]|uniref:Uncharacterized protein n=1 Tax=Seminavis robusta TaxID=568900 RepID=A0A9N8H6Z8_9STRA|nr:expressed unknown protein [Seminavis robusta]|eukprot:Sro114_g056480.1 n/a (391) ;mRNA; f:83470-84642